MTLLTKTKMTAAIAVVAFSAFAAGSASAFTIFPVQSGTTINLTPINQTQTFSAPNATGDGYYYTFTTAATYSLAFTDTGNLNAMPVENDFIVTTGSVPGSGTTVATSTFGTFASGAQATLAAGTYTLLVSSTTPLEALSGTVSAGAVPEPAAWAMMLVGFGALGGLMRRRQRGLAVAV